ncbi:hypothetical protein [Oryzibacter oryziterrae]|uniref:hypothetical protein n=1 Tax=Oryzibacter oryziterrae TaxID=2766474 RepID=UPI001F29476A|nr:hypothetical protein [Oryzibacter oryziterrae]
MIAFRLAAMAQGWRARFACRSGCPALPFAALLTALLTTGIARAESPRVAFTGPPGHQTLLIDGEPARYDPEADRLIARLHLSDGLRQVARDVVAVDMAKGISARAAVEGWAMRRQHCKCHVGQLRQYFQ